MRRIALCISLAALCVVACSRRGNSHVADKTITIATLDALAEHGTVRIGSDMWLEGCVVLNDKLGESFKSFVLYDSSAGVEVEIDIENVDAVVPLYSEVRMRCEGLYVGREHGRLVLGTEPTSHYTVDRIPQSEVANRIEVVRHGDESSMMKSIAVADVGEESLLHYVVIGGVKLVAEEHGSAWCDTDAKERPFDSSLRHFTDGCDTLTVAILNRCHYATERISCNIVTLVGVVYSYDNDIVLRLANNQLYNL